MIKRQETHEKGNNPGARRQLASLNERKLGLTQAQMTVEFKLTEQLEEAEAKITKQAGEIFQH